jgi:hypothetical protein
MEQDSDECVYYLKALRQSAGSHGTGAAPARETGSQAPSDPAVPFENSALPAGVKGEKRRSARYKCEGSAELREEGCDVHTWASFTDISLHGCYVEAQATYPAGTVLHMKLEANGVRVEAKGNVRVNYPYLGMGIAFVDMSEENHACLKELLSKISHRTLLVEPMIVEPMIVGPGIASSLPPDGSQPLISDPHAVVQALVEFFENRQMLMRKDFLRILGKTQTAAHKP